MSRLGGSRIRFFVRINMHGRQARWEMGGGSLSGDESSRTRKEECSDATPTSCAFTSV